MNLRGLKDRARDETSTLQYSTENLNWKTTVIFYLSTFKYT
jgi:hypothetical protein